MYNIPSLCKGNVLMVVIKTAVMFRGLQRPDHWPKRLIARHGAAMRHASPSNPQTLKPHPRFGRENPLLRAQCFGLGQIAKDSLCSVPPAFSVDWDPAAREQPVLHRQLKAPSAVDLPPTTTDSLWSCAPADSAAAVDATSCNTVPSHSALCCASAALIPAQAQTPSASALLCQHICSLVAVHVYVG